MFNEAVKIDNPDDIYDELYEVAKTLKGLRELINGLCHVIEDHTLPNVEGLDVIRDICWHTAMRVDAISDCLLKADKGGNNE